MVAVRAESRLLYFIFQRYLVGGLIAGGVN
jgi:ABC-type glycerol-3-phosphate transport system permease component